MTIPVNRAMITSKAAAAASTKIDRFPSDLGSHGMLMVFNEYVFQQPTTRPLLDYRTSGSSAIQQSKGAVLLPIPNTLIDSTTLNVHRFDMADTPGYESMATAMIGEYALNLNGNMQDVGIAIKKLFGNNFYLGAVSQGLGVTLNPKASLLFKGVELREYSLNWVLAPTEEKESDTLKTIVDKIRANSLPDYRTDSFFTAAMFSYPSTVDIYLLGVDPGHYMRFKTAMIRNVSINYTPNGLSVLRGGKPSSIDLNISFQEMDIQTTKDYNGSSSSGT